MGSRRSENSRQLVAQEAARILAEEGIDDFHLAKRKAAERLGLTDAHLLPGNDEIEIELLAYQRLFQSESQPQHLLQLRIKALQAMKLLNGFEPRLVGSVLSGSANQHDTITLHLFADSPEMVAIFLINQKIPYEIDEQSTRYSSQETELKTVYRFWIGGDCVTATVFDFEEIKKRPLSPISGKPMQRAKYKKVEELVYSSTTHKE